MGQSPTIPSSRIGFRLLAGPADGKGAEAPAQPRTNRVPLDVEHRRTQVRLIKGHILAVVPSLGPWHTPSMPALRPDVKPSSEVDDCPYLPYSPQQHKLIRIGLTDLFSPWIVIRPHLPSRPHAH